MSLMKGNPWAPKESSSTTITTAAPAAKTTAASSGSGFGMSKGLGVVSGLIGLYGNYKASQAEASALESAAGGFRQDSILLGNTSRLNSILAAEQDLRVMDNLTEGFRRVSSQQITQQVSSGLSLDSKSFMAIQDETLTAYERSIRNNKVDSTNRERIADFNTKVKQGQLEHQARVREHQANAAKRNGILDLVVGAAGVAGAAFTGGTSLAASAAILAGTQAK